MTEKKQTHFEKVMEQYRKTNEKYRKEHWLEKIDLNGVDDWDLVERECYDSTFDKALEKWMWVMFGFLKKVWETFWGMTVDEIKYSFNINALNKLKELKSLTKANFNPNIDKFIQLIDDLSKDEKYCSGNTLTISKLELDNLIKTKLAWFEKIMSEGHNYYEVDDWACDWMSGHIWDPKHDNVSDEYNEDDYWRPGDQPPQSEYAKCKNEYWIWRLKNFEEFEDSIETLQTVTLDDPKSLTDEDFAFIEELFLVIKYIFYER